MRRIATANPQFEHCSGPVPVMLFEPGDTFPDLGPVVGVDTETEKITETCFAPPLSVLGVFDPGHRVCYIVRWPEARGFMRDLCTREVEQWYFNLGFDEQVLSNEDPEERPLVQAISAGRVIDMQIRTHLRELATIGYIRSSLYSLAGCSLALLNWEMDKGDGTDESDRLSFRRFDENGNPYMPTTSQCEYLAMDCITTWALGATVGPQATETAHTKGMCVLAHITSNGIYADRKVWDYFYRRLWSDRDKYRRELIGFGFPDPDKRNVSETEDARQHLLAALSWLEDNTHAGFPLPVNWKPGKNQLRRAICYLYNNSDAADEVILCVTNVSYVLLAENKPLKKKEQDFWDKLCEDHEILPYDTAKKGIALVWLVTLLLKDYAEQARGELPLGFSFDAAMERVLPQMDEHPEWMADVPKVGPRKFFVDKVAELEARTGITLERTEKSCEPQLTKKDMWRLEDAGVEEPFLEAYTNYNHVIKYISTYLKPEFIRSDGRVHARFTNLLKTGRTSCSGPNLQQLPSRDAEYSLRLVYSATPGKVLCATDFSFIELCAFGQACYTRFGYSVMRDVINAGLDPHRWFAGVMNKVITPDLSKAKDPEWVKAMGAFLKEHISDSQRALAKMGNFG